MTDLMVLLLAMVLQSATPAAHGAPAEKAPAAAGQKGAHGNDGAKGGPASADPLSNLKPHEERRYRADMQDCEKAQGADRRLCERSVHNRAAAKSRRRGAAGG